MDELSTTSQDDGVGMKSMNCRVDGKDSRLDSGVTRSARRVKDYRPEKTREPGVAGLRTVQARDTNGGLCRTGALRWGRTC